MYLRYETVSIPIDIGIQFNNKYFPSVQRVHWQGRMAGPGRAPNTKLKVECDHSHLTLILLQKDKEQRKASKSKL